VNTTGSQSTIPGSSRGPISIAVTKNHGWTRIGMAPRRKVITQGLTGRIAPGRRGPTVDARQGGILDWGWL